MSVVALARVMGLQKNMQSRGTIPINSSIVWVGSSSFSVSLGSHHRVKVPHLILTSYLSNFLPELTQVPRPGVTQHRHHPMAGAQPPRHLHRRNAVHRAAAPYEDPLALHQPSSHPPCPRIRHPHRVIDQRQALLKVRRQPITSDPLDDAVDLMSSPRSLPLPLIEHHTVLDLVIQSASLRIRQHDLDRGKEWLQELGDPGDGSTGAGTGNKGVEARTALAVDLGPGGGVVREPVGGILELVGEEAVAGVRGVPTVERGQRAGAINELQRGNDGCGRRAVDRCTEVQQEGGLFERLVA